MGTRYNLYVNPGRISQLIMETRPWSRKVVGLAMSERLKDELKINSLEMVIKDWGVEPIVHSDQGIQYPSWNFQNILKQNGLLSSMRKR